MSKRSWIITFASGLALLVALTLLFASWFAFSTYQGNQAIQREEAASYQAENASASVSTCNAAMSERGFIDWLSCLIEHVSADGDAKQSQYDLQAQQDMAAWAFGMLIVTIWIAVITFLGVLFVWRTLIATRKMAEATRVIGEAQARAYLHAEFIQVGTEMVANADGSNIKFFAKINVINSGTTPAYGVEVLYDIREGQSGDIEEINLLRDGQISSEILSFIPQKGNQTTKLKRVWRAESPDGLLRGGKNHIRLIWAFRFIDEFGRNEEPVRYRETPITSGSFHEFEGSLCFFPDKLEYTKPDDHS